MLAVVRRALAGLAGLYACTAMLGWLLDRPAWTSLGVSAARTSFATATCTLVLAVAIAGHVPARRARGWSKAVTAGCCAAVLVICGVALCQYVLGVQDAGYLLGRGWGRLSPATAACFLFLALGLAAVALRRYYASVGLTGVALLIAATAVVGYLYNVHSLTRVFGFSAMALPTSIAIMLLGNALLMLEPERGWLRHILAGAQARRAFQLMMPGAVIVPFIVIIPANWAVAAGLFGTSFGFAVVTVAMVAALAFMVMLTCARLERIDRADARVAAIVESSATAILIVDGGGRIVQVNRATEALFGHDRATLIGSALECLVPERYRAHHPAYVSGFLSAPSERPMGAGRDLYGLRADGGEFPVEIGLSPVETAEGVFTLASIVDITLRKQVEAEQAHLAAIVESSDDAIIGKGLDGVITSWNRGAESLFGYSAAEAVGQRMQIVIPEERAAEEKDILASINRKEHINHFETVRRRKDGSTLDVSATISPITLPSGAVIGASSIIRDISARKLKDLELERSNAELEQFAYVASHDLQEPLRMVANYVELLSQRYKGQLDERADKFIHYASDGARRMQQLVSDLLAYSRVGSQGKPLVPVDTDAVVDRVLHSLDGRLRASGGTVERGELPRAMGDEIQISQLFQNLISNAIKFRRGEPPLIRVAGELRGAQVRYSVTDNGIGMDMRFADRIFQMFQRLHERTAYEGSGIGLAIAKRIVERHGGSIWVESEPGRGTTMYFTLAAAK